MIKKYFDFGKPLIYRQFLGKRLFQNIRKYQPRGNHHHQHQFDDDGDNDHLTHLRNKRKSQQKYKVKDSYHNQWPCLHLSKKGVCMVHCSVCKTDFSCLQTCWQKWLSKTHWVENAPTIIENWEIKRLWLRLLQNCQLKWSNKDQSPGLRLWCAKLLLSLTATGVLNKSVKLCSSIKILL